MKDAKAAKKRNVIPDGAQTRPVLDGRVAQACLVFLDRAQIQGNEAETMQVCKAALRQHIQPQAVT